MTLFFPYAAGAGQFIVVVVALFAFDTATAGDKELGAIAHKVLWGYIGWGLSRRWWLPRYTSIDWLIVSIQLGRSPFIHSCFFTFGMLG